jgi:hypothetical protein
VCCFCWMGYLLVGYKLDFCKIVIFMICGSVTLITAHFCYFVNLFLYYLLQAFCCCAMAALPTAMA